MIWFKGFFFGKKLEKRVVRIITFETKIDSIMKKTIILSFNLLIGAAALAQPSVTNAYNANRDGDYVAAAQYIEQAVNDPKASAKEKTWRYRGDIYLNIAKDSKLREQFPDAIKLAKESYMKNRELDKMNDYKGEVLASMGQLQQVIAGITDEQLKAKDYCNAGNNFQTMAEISSAFNVVDTAMIFNSAYCFDQCGKFDLAINGYNECIKYSYNVPDTYRYLSDVYTRNNQKEEARKVLSDARSKFPNDADLLTAEVNILLGNQEYVKAEELLVALTQKDASNEMYWYVLGVTYDKLAKKAEEEKAYLKAIELKPNYYDARFNLGALFFNQGVEKDTQCNDIPPRETAKYNDCVAQSAVLFKKSVEHLEGAYNNIPENLKGTQEEKQLITALKDAYYKAGQEADYQRMKELLGK